MSHTDFNYTDFTDSDLEKFVATGWSGGQLDLQGTDLTDQGLRHLTSIGWLSELRLKDNPQLTDACIEHLSAVSSLNLLHIENTKISIHGLRKLLDNVKLESVILGSEFNNSFDELLALSALHPDLEILFKGRGIITKGELQE